MSETSVIEFINELGAGTLKEKLAAILSEVAHSTVEHGDKTRVGKVALELTIRKFGDQEQVVISHKLSKVSLTKRGKKAEEDTTETAFFVGRNGQMTIQPPREEHSGQKPFQLHKGVE